MTPRALILAQTDALHNRDRDAVILRALGLFLSACLILAWAGLKLTPKSIGAS